MCFLRSPCEIDVILETWQMGFAVTRFPGALGAAVIEASITLGVRAAGSPALGADGFVDPSLVWRSAAV